VSTFRVGDAGSAMARTSRIDRMPACNNQSAPMRFGLAGAAHMSRQACRSAVRRMPAVPDPTLRASRTVIGCLHTPPQVRDRGLPKRTGLRMRDGPLPPQERR